MKTEISPSGKGANTIKRRQTADLIKNLLKILVTALLLYWVFSKVPIGVIRNRLLGANRLLMLAAVFCYFLSMIASAWRLSSFFKSIGLKLSYQYNMRLYFIGIFYNALLPGGIGGDGYKIFLLNKNYQIPVKKLLWAIIFDRLSGLWAIALIATALITAVAEINVNPIVCFGLFGIISSIYILLSKHFFKEYVRLFWEGHLKAVVVQLFQLLTVVCIMLGQDFSGNYIPYLLSYLISALTSVVPLTIGGAGAREAVFAKLADFLPMDTGLCVFLASSFYIVTLIVSAIGSYYVIKNKKTDRDAGIGDVSEPDLIPEVH
jgi:uncharacterized membrane protein YbhN (UPF0104 family)